MNDDHSSNMKIKVKHGRHPNSLKNLKPIKPGQVLNPLGAAIHDPILKALKKLSSEAFRDLLNLALAENVSALEAIIDDKDAPAIKVGIARALEKAITDGDWCTLKSIVESLIGKDALTFVSQVEQTVVHYNMEEVRAMIEKVQNDC